MRLPFDVSGLAATAMQGRSDAIAVCAANEDHYRIQTQHKPRRQNMVSCRGLQLPSSSLYK